MTGTARESHAPTGATKAGARGRRPCGGGQPWARSREEGEGVLLALAIGCGGGERRGQARDNSRLRTDGWIETAGLGFSGSEVAAPPGLCRYDLRAPKGAYNDSLNCA